MVTNGNGQTLVDRLREPSYYKAAIVSAEFGLKRRWPIYSGGLGILAGDWLKEAADRGYPIVGLGIAYHKGYFRQLIDENGWQTEESINFNPLEHGFQLLNLTEKTNINGRDVTVGVYEYTVKGRKIGIPLYLLTTNLPQNTDWDRGLTAKLYDDGSGNPDYYRTAQYRILATGVRLLQHLGYDIQTHHLNDGHGALVALELLNQGLSPDKVREKIWLTTHTPVQAAFYHFDFKEVKHALPNEWKKLVPYLNGKPYFGTAEFAIAMSRGVNAVSKRHAEVSSQMDIFKGVKVIPITNGIHLPTWVSHDKAELYERYLPGIFENPGRFNEVDSIPFNEYEISHRNGKKFLFDLIQDRTGVQFDSDGLTIGFARRGVEYKRADLILYDLEDLARIMKDKTQIVFAGKAPPGHEPSKLIIQNVWRKCEELRKKYGVNAVFVPNYGIETAKALVAGVDVWLNNPRRPEEASGTSGMKVAANGGVNFSVLDGWWYESYNGRNGWAIAPDNHSNNLETDSAAIRHELEHSIIPVYNDKSEWERKVQESLRLAAYFNTARNLAEYMREAYDLPLEERIERGVLVVH